MRLSLATPYRLHFAAAVMAVALVVGACGSAVTSPPASTGSASPVARPSIVVTFPVLGSLVKDLVGDAAEVTVLMPNGADPHDWSPSARDIEGVGKASFVVAHGLDLEAGLHDAIEEAEKAGIPVFVAAEHVQVREMGETGHEHEGGDPHFWLDPVSMRAVAAALAEEITDDLGLPVTDRAADLDRRLAALDEEVRSMLKTVPEANRKLVTGHESMGYFADRYGYQLIGTIIPGLTTQGEASAGELAALKEQIEREKVPAIFAEIGTPAAVAEAIAQETGARVVRMALHTLPADGSYFTLIREMVRTIVDALK